MWAHQRRGTVAKDVGQWAKRSKAGEGSWSPNLGACLHLGGREVGHRDRK